MVAKVSIDGGVYANGKIAAKTLGVNYSTLRDRIKSRSDKYLNWKMFPVRCDIVINDRNYNDIDTAIIRLVELKYEIKRRK
jgi:hypothetical protein